VGLTERAFFRRELKIEFELLLPSFEIRKKFKDHRNLLIASTNPLIWRDSLKNLPDSSVIFFLLGNETYEPTIFNSLNDIRSIRHVFVYNPVSKIQKNVFIFSIVADLYDQLPNLSYRGVLGALRDLRTSMHLQEKFSATFMNYSWSSLPQGYSNSFESGLTQLGITSERNESLIGNSFQENLQSTLKKKKQFIFVGQPTNRRRAQILGNFQGRTDSVIITKYSGFGGNVYDGDITYVNGILESWFNIIPPGFFNNLNHRYTESCIVGSIPLILAHNSIDHSSNANWTNRLDPFRSHSFRKLAEYVDSLQEDQLKVLSQEIAQQDFMAIQKARSLFLQSIS
jgi:hypothetical protein